MTLSSHPSMQRGAQRDELDCFPAWVVRQAADLAGPFDDDAPSWAATVLPLPLSALAQAQPAEELWR